MNKNLDSNLINYCDHNIITKDLKSAALWLTELTHQVLPLINTYFITNFHQMSKFPRFQRSKIVTSNSATSLPKIYSSGSWL